MSIEVVLQAARAVVAARYDGRMFLTSERNDEYVCACIYALAKALKQYDAEDA